MAEFINRDDSLNEGRVKINKSIQDAEDAKVTAQDADEKADQALSNSESTQEQLDQVVIEGDSSVEAAQARVDTEGNIHQTLKERLDYEHSSVTSQLAETSKVVNVESFGAIGDGITDDGQALKEAHEYANEHKMKVEYGYDKDYYVGDVSLIPIQTSVNFNNCRIHIDDSFHNTHEVFSVIEDNPIIEVQPSHIATTITTNTRRIPELSGYGEAFVVIENNNKKIYRRRGYGQEHNQTDWFAIDNDGVLLNKTSFNFSSLTSVQVQPISKQFIKLENLHSINSGDTEGSTRILRGFKIKRSKVIIDNFEHGVEQNIPEANPSEGILFIERCCNILISNSLFTPRKHVGDGSYEIRTDLVADLTFFNVNGFTTSPDYWGILGGNRMKDFKVLNSKINRVDSHLGSHNITIENSKIGNGGLTLIGQGDLIVRNTEIHSDNLLSLRTDYGATWEGDIYFDGIKHFPDNEPSLFSWANYLDHDYGYDCYLGKNIVSIKNYELFNEGIPDLPYIFNITLHNESERQHDYLMADRFEFVNVKTHANGFMVFLDSGDNYTGLRSRKEFNYELIERITSTNLTQIIEPNIEIIIDNVDLADRGYDVSSNLFTWSSTFGMDFSDDYEAIKKRLLPRFVISNCDEVYATVRSLPAIIEIYNSVVRSAYNRQGNGSKSKIFFNNCKIESKSPSSNSSDFRGNRNYMFFNDCEIMPVLLPDGTRVTDSGIISEYSFLTFGYNDNFINQYANLSNTMLNGLIDITTMKEDWSDYNYVFGNHSNDEWFPRKRGATDQRPPKNIVEIGEGYFDTTLGKLVFYNGSDWE